MRSPDSEDDYLIALATICRSVLVSCDSDLFGLSGRIPVRSPVAFLAMIETAEANSI